MRAWTYILRRWRHRSAEAMATAAEAVATGANMERHNLSSIGQLDEDTKERLKKGLMTPEEMQALGLDENLFAKDDDDEYGEEELDEEPETGVFRVSFRLFFCFRAAVTVFLLPFAFFVLKLRTGLNDR